MNPLQNECAKLISTCTVWQVRLDSWKSGGGMVNAKTGVVLYNELKTYSKRNGERDL